MDEADNIVHISRVGVEVGVNKMDINDDLDLFFNSRFKTINDTDKIVHSNYIIALYYFAKNYNKVYQSLFQDLQKEIQKDYHTYSSSSKKIYIMLECFGLMINIIFAGLIIFFLNESNKEIFRNILNLFIDNTQPDNIYTFKNHMDNVILIEKLNQFKYLMGNFNLNSLDKYNKVIPLNTAVLLDQNKLNNFDETLNVNNESNRNNNKILGNN